MLIIMVVMIIYYMMIVHEFIHSVNIHWAISICQIFEILGMLMNERQKISAFAELIFKVVGVRHLKKVKCELMISAVGMMEARMWVEALTRRPLKVLQRCRIWRTRFAPGCCSLFHPVKMLFIILHGDLFRRTRGRTFPLVVELAIVGLLLSNWFLFISEHPESCNRSCLPLYLGYKET